MQRLHQQHAVHAVDEVDRPRQAEPVLQQHVQRPRPTHDEREAEHADERRRDDRDQREIAEEVPADELVAHEQEGDGEAEDGGRGHRAEAEQQRVDERPPVEVVAGKLDEVHQREPPCLVAEGVVKDSQEWIDEEDGEERPDQRDTQRRQGGRQAARRGHRGARLTHRAA
jgi:hypothetical protein